MASAVPVLLLLSAALFTTTVADNDCESYISSHGLYNPSIECNFLQFCCGDCNNRYCCSNPLQVFPEDAQSNCVFNDFTPIAIGVSVAAIVIFIIFFIVCCVCPCCCLYKMCRKPAPIVTTTTHTVISAQYPQQPVVPAGQYPPYQTVAPPGGYRGQPGYGGQQGYGGPPMPTGPYQAQPYIAGPPPPYQEAGGPGYPAPYSQAAFDGGQASYPIQPPVHPGFAQAAPQTDYSSTQPAYNPAYMEPPKTGF